MKRVSLKLQIISDKSSNQQNNMETCVTALSFRIGQRLQEEVYFIAKMPNFAHSDAEAPPSVFLYHINKNF